MTIRVLAFAAVVGGVVGISAPAGALGQEPVYPGPGIVNPVSIRQVEASYTPAARQARVQGSVELEAVILPNGTVGEIRIAKSLDSQHGLDQQAVAAARQWLFRPGTKDGRAVPIRVTFVLTFRLDNELQRVTSVEMRREADAVTRLAPPDEFVMGAYSPDTPGLTKPRILRQPEPKYTSAAMKAKIQGEVAIEAVIAADGTVARARVKTSLDKVNGLDEEALRVVKLWTFEPATLGGLKVPVLVDLVLAFRLH